MNINLKQTSFAGILSALGDVNVPAPSDQDVLTWDVATSKWIAQAVAGTFLALTDTPATYAGEAGSIVRVNATPDALEFGPALYVSDIAPVGGDGNNGDLWFEY